MNNTHKHIIFRLIVGAFLIFGIGFWMSKFVVNAATWNVGGVLSRDNQTSYLSPSFWDVVPTTEDIITALYGTGDEGTIYTKNWTGYNSGSCLSGGMNVLFVSTIPSIPSLPGNTIYVVESGTYTITTPIVLNDCTAIVSSGIVIVSGDAGGGFTAGATNKNNIIIEKLRIDQGNYGYNGLAIEGGTNMTIKDFQAYNNIGTTTAGLLLSGFSYGDIINTQFYGNANGLYINNSAAINADNIQSRNNRAHGLRINNSTTIKFNGVTSYQNLNMGLLITSAALSTIKNFTGYDNTYYGLAIVNSSGNSFNFIETYNNGMRGVFANKVENSDFTDINSTHNANGFSLNYSTGNTLTNINVYGNYYGGIDFYNANYNTGTNITSNSSSGCLYLDRSSYNNFFDVTTTNSPDNGVVLVSGSNYNLLSGLVSSGNMGHGLYYANSNSNTITNSIIQHNDKGGIIIETGLSNNIVYSNINSNNGGGGFAGNGIVLSYCSGTTIDGLNVSGNLDHGITLEYSDYTQITNSTIDTNNVDGIYFGNSNSNTVSGCILSGNNIHGFEIKDSNNSTITNSYVFSPSTWFNSILLYNSTGTTVDLFSGNNDIREFHGNGLFQHTYYDTYTQAINEIGLHSYDSATLTGNSLSMGETLSLPFDTLKIDQNLTPNHIILSGYNSFVVRGDTRNGIFYAPTQITVGPKLCTIGEAGTEFASTIYDTIEVISGNTYLTMAGGSGTINYQIPSGTSGQFFGILNSSNGSTWNVNTPDYGCILNQSLECIFNIAGGDIKLFAFGVPGLYFTGTTLGSLSSGDVVAGGYYNTGIYITFTGAGLSGATLNGTDYTEGTTIFAESSYVFEVSNLWGGTTGMTFTIDTTPPTIIGADDGDYYNTDILIIGSDTIGFSGFDLNGAWYPGNSLTVTGEGTWVITGYDFAGNTTGITFTIDKTAPTIVGVTSGAYYNHDILITGSDIVGFNGFELNGIRHLGNSLTVTGEGTWVVVGYDLAGNTTGATFTIDKTAPTITGVTSGAYYSGNVLITGSDNIAFYGFLLNGTGYTGSSINITGDGIRTITGYDKALNPSTGITFTIDKTTPRFTGYTISGTIMHSGGYYNTTGYVIDFGDTNISGATLDGVGYTSTIMTNTGTHIFIVKDIVGHSTGMIFTIDRTNPIVTGNYPTSGLNFSGGNDITFSWSGVDDNMSGYTLYITGTEIHSGTTTANTATVHLMNGSYTWYVIATDRAGNTGISQMKPFTIFAPFSGNATLTGPALYIGSNRYTKLAPGVAMRANDPALYAITGDIDAGTITGIFSGQVTAYPLLTGVDGGKDIFVTMTNSSGEVVSKTLLVYLDTASPAPTLITPTSGGSAAGTFTLSWTGGTDTLFSGYQYYISPTSSFGTIVASGTTTSTSATITNGSISITGTLYWKVKSIDRLGNEGTSAIQSFTYTGVVDTTPSQFSFNDITDADLDEIYISNTITIAGMTTGINVLATITSGALYISGNMVGTTGYIQNGWTAKIELNSSDEYNEHVSSTLTIGGMSDTFTVTTMEEDSNGDNYGDIDTDLSNTERLMIIAVFETLRDLYAGDKEEEFLNTLMVMLENKMEDLDEGDDDYNALKYLYDLVEQYYSEGDFGENVDTAPRIVNGIYTAPNGKKYTITYDSTKQRFTSTNFMTPKYFPTLDTLKYIIDMNNPIGSQYANSKTLLARFKNAAIDGTWQTSPYTAPNHKVFYFFKSIDGRYSSYTFTAERYFDSLDDVKGYIYTNNR